MHCHIVAYNANCMIFGVLSHALKPIKKALTSFETMRYINRRGVGPRLARRGAMTMKTNGRKRALTFGDFIAAAYRAWGTRRANGLVRLAFNARLVVFRGGQRFMISEE